MDLETPIPRRVLIRNTLGSGLLLWLGGLTLPALAAAKPKEGLKVLTPDEYGIVSSVARCILDDGAVPDLDAVAARVALRIDREVQYWDAHNREQFRQLLGLFEHGTLLLGFRWGPFSAMRPDDREAYMRDWMQSSWELKRQGFMTFKTLVAFFHYTLDETWERIGYDGPWVDSKPMPLD